MQKSAASSRIKIDHNVYVEPFVEWVQRGGRSTRFMCLESSAAMNWGSMHEMSDMLTESFRATCLMKRLFQDLGCFCLLNVLCIFCNQTPLHG